MSQLQVLLVDDTSCVRDLLTSELSQLAKVTHASSVEEACQLTRNTAPPDLLICDFRLGTLNGGVLASMARRNWPLTAIVMLANRSDRERAAESCEGGVDEVIEKPFFVSEALTRIRRMMSRLGVENAARGHRCVSGTLDQMGVVDLLQSLEMGRKTCLLELKSGEKLSKLYFGEGRLDDALLGDLRGDDAVFPVMGWTNGSFKIDFSVTPAMRTTTPSTQGILLEGLRLFDEHKRDLAQYESA